MTALSSAPRGFDPAVYFVTDTALCGDRGVVETVRQAVLGGVHTVQVRAKNESAAEAFELLVAVGQVCQGHATVLMNDRVDVYLAAKAAGAWVQGVHVGQGDLPVRWVRELVGSEAIVGLTANTAAHFDAIGALTPGTVSYAGVGVIRPTSTKADHPEPLGIDGFAGFALASSVPCVAIGGVRRDDLPAIRQAGGVGAAVVSLLCLAADPRREAELLVAAWNSPAADTTAPVARRVGERDNE
ncbi:thiamine phosphate synthase [Subtercola vilae]|uniref:thiamine phosphate synthase n=1 Tax=Subtercola vilae TaxID=2056433 RepID=UPI001EEE9A70|nr:thiamine phosphate synthase [Subtercola vilae]